jgi:hypothetical protein
MGRQYRRDRRVRQEQKWEKPACADPESAQYGHHHWVEWGGDSRFQRCRRCGTVIAQDISNEARYARVPITERAVVHHHTFEPSLLDGRYERCFCGATRIAESVAERVSESAGAA